MLASISPLGERARGNRWWLTAAAYTTASVGAAALIGAALGTVGTHRPVVFGVAAVAAAVVDFAAPTRIPSWRRQVNREWLSRYRGWVYGVGFGAQLGAGVVTVVNTATVYAWMVGAAVSGSPGTGAMVGAAFGIARAAPLLLVAGDDTPARLQSSIRGLTAWARPARYAGAAAAAAIGLAGLVK
jgi:hypothetical protein